MPLSMSHHEHISYYGIHRASYYPYFHNSTNNPEFPEATEREFPNTMSFSHVLILFVSFIVAVSASVDCTKTPCPTTCVCTDKVCLNKDGIRNYTTKHNCYSTDVNKTTACTDCLKRVSIDSIGTCAAGNSTKNSSGESKTMGTETKKEASVESILRNLPESKSTPAPRKASCVSTQWIKQHGLEDGISGA